ncbi:YajG family lipoprotein [Colwellia sp. 4_MG-2023]|jgi:uncharacterized lipoprotein|uniref:YajG family lipoprotein n=1 Tax=unclassified Colwellia TaxID=196834 RepID=UPI001C090B24|nr:MULTISPECIES: YajG family lipoprotein [unclassified Colwellia]MBU2925171.1 YajG family lipoprotein [Colwellia sp. C2M11]MDO6486670.1 YajG family lipoprotein [Colwellia sp. 6_MG-2023]MDO6506739.1 YajG family lipoprotein [Colwellia sp. 5_MG-2023]MDO6555565.1 YajG family lipoprotein [Colwellia sp. 4_MG-2023]MDO6651304.1 YajG family lipoprotein [Colwellia sp. 3_MG-2023]
MKFNTVIHQVTACLLLLGLYGCANVPSHIIIAPEIMNVSNTVQSNKKAQLDVVDMRTSNHIVQIMREGKAAILVSAQERLENTIQDTLTEHWKKQHLTLNNNAINNINISIDKAIINVEQATFEYKVQTEIILKVIVNNGSETLTSTFKNRGNSDGPFKADIAVLERNFNERLAKLLQQIIANQKINDFLI